MNSEDELRNAFVAAMAQVATPVTVVTTEGDAGRFGITVSAVSSVSADPPMLLVCINRKSPATEAISGQGSFAVNILAHDDRSVAETFSGRPKEGLPYDFSSHKWVKGALGLPLLDEAAASFECVVDKEFDAGTHRIFVGLVRAVRQGTLKPLVYYKREFARVATARSKT